MQVNEKLSEGLTREVEVVIPATDLVAKLEEYLDDMKDKVQIKGFRQGKVPRAHLKKLYGRSAMGEIVNNVVGESIQQVFDDRDEKPAQQPDLDVDEKTVAAAIEGDGDLAFSMKYEVLPNFELGDFASIEVERQVADVAKEEIDERLDQIVLGNRPYEAREEGAAAEDKDRVTIDYLGKVNGEPFEGGTDTDSQLVLGSNQFIPGFEEQLIGAKAGEERVVKLEFPAEYQAAHLAGKAAEFEVTVKEVAAPGDVDINDEFAQQFGVQSLEELRGKLQEQIEGEFGYITRQKVKRQLLDKLDEMHTFDLPPGLVVAEFDGIWKQLESDMERDKRSFEDDDKTEEETREEYQTIAQRRVRLGLVLSEVGEKNEIQVTDEEVQRALFERMRQFPGQEKQIMEFYQQDANALASLRAPIFEEKVVDYILELAKVEDKKVSKDDLIAAMEEDDA